MEEATETTQGAMRHSADIKEISPALLAAQKAAAAPEKSAYNKHQDYKYAELGDIITACKEGLMEHGILLLQYCGPGRTALHTKLLHANSGQWMEFEYPLVVNAIKGPVHARDIAASVTYARKTALCSIMFITATDKEECAGDQDEEQYDPPGRSASPDPGPPRGGGGRWSRSGEAQSSTAKLRQGLESANRDGAPAAKAKPSMSLPRAEQVSRPQEIKRLLEPATNLNDLMERGARMKGLLDQWQDEEAAKYAHDYFLEKRARLCGPKPADDAMVG